MITLAPELADANPGLEHILSNLDLIDASWRQIVRDDASTSVRACCGASGTRWWPSN